MKISAGREPFPPVAVKTVAQTRQHWGSPSSPVSLYVSVIVQFHSGRFSSDQTVRFPLVVVVGCGIRCQIFMLAGDRAT